MKARVDVGKDWLVDGRIVVAKEESQTGWIFLDPMSNLPLPYTHAELWEKCLQGAAHPIKPELNQSVSHVSMVTESEWVPIERQLRYIRAYENAPRGYRSGAKLEQIIKEVADKARDPWVPGVRTVKEWKSELDAGLGNPLVLLDRRSRGRKSRLKPLTQQAMEKYIDEKYLVFRGPPLAQVHKKFKKEEIPRLRAAHPDNADQYVMPCENTFRNYVDSLDKFFVMSRREGEEAARKYLSVYGIGPRYERPLQCVQIDTWKKHIIHTDSKGNPLGRLWVAVVIDCCSRAIVGMYIGPEPPCAWTVLQAIRNALMPKNHLREKYPEIVSDNPVGGKWEMACFDQGPENQNKQIVRCLGSLGSVQDFGPKGQPGDRGIIERFFGTMAQALIHRLPGATFSDIEDRGDYDPVAHACLTAEDIICRVYQWVNDEYHNSHHSELDDTPMNVFRKGMEKYGVLPPPPIDEVALLVSQKTIRTIQKSGIQMHNTFYLGDGLGFLKGRKVPDEFRVADDPNETRGEDEVEVFYDDGNLGSIWAVDRRNTPATVIRCTARYPEYSEGLTKWQDAAIRREIRESNTPETIENLLAKRREMFARFAPKNLSKKRVNRAAAMFQAPTRPLQAQSNTLSPRGREPRDKRPSTHERETRPSAVKSQSPTPIRPKAPVTARRDLYGGK